VHEAHIRPLGMEVRLSLHLQVRGQLGKVRRCLHGGNVARIFP
jgi:hypothetical protein